MFGVTVAAISSRLYLCLAHDEVLLVCHLTPAVGSMDFYLLVIALALQLQTILGEQLASDDQAADVVDIGTVISLAFHVVDALHLERRACISTWMPQLAFAGSLSRARSDRSATLPP